MDWISSFFGFFLEQFANAANIVDLRFNLHKVVLICIALLLVLSFGLAKSKR
jgi:hypothetical protein